MLGNEDKDGYELLKRAQAMMASGIPTNRGNVVNQFGGYTPTADLQTQRMQAQAPIEQPKPKEQLAPASGVDMVLGKGGELLFKDNGAKREVLNLIGAPSNAQKVEYRINRNLTEGQGKPYYDFIIVDSKGREIESEAVSGETLGILLSGIAKDEKESEASFKRNRRVREKGGEWRPGFELPFEDGLIEVKQNTDWDRDLGDFAGRAFSNTFGTSSDMIIGGVQGGLRAASGLVGGRNNTIVGEALDNAADSDILTGGRELAQKAIRNQGFENEFANAASSGVGSVATIMGLPGVGLGVAALSAYESGVEKSRELAARQGEKSSNMADLAMGVGYGTVEFLMERLGGRAIKGAINPGTAKKLGQKMFDAAMEANPALFSRFVSRVGDTGGAAAVNFIEEAATSLGQEVINDAIYEVDRDLYRTLKDAGMAGVGGAFGGGFARGGVVAAESAQGFSDRTRRSMVGEPNIGTLPNNETGIVPFNNDYQEIGNIRDLDGAPVSTETGVTQYEGSGVLGEPVTSKKGVSFDSAEDATVEPEQEGLFTSPSVFSEQENYAVTRLQRLGFTESDAIEEVKANRTGQKANTESYQKLTQEFPESKPAVESLLSKAKKVYGNSAAKVRNIFGSARQEMDASVDEQIAAAESITTPPATPTTPQTPPGETQPTETPIAEETPVNEVVDEEFIPEDYIPTDEELDDLAADDIDPSMSPEETMPEEAPIENTEPLTQEEPAIEDGDIKDVEDETGLGSFDEEAINPLMRIDAIKSSLKGFEFSVGALTASARKSTLINIAAQKLGIDKSLLKIEGGAVNYSTPDGKKIKVATVEKGRKLSFNEQDVNNYVSAITTPVSPVSAETLTPQSTEVTQPGKRRRTKAQRAKDALEASRQSFTDAIDDAIEGSAGVSLVPGLSASTLLKIIRAAGIKMNHLAVKALDEYINIEAQAIANGTSTLAQAVNNVKNHLSNGVAKGVSFIADNEIAELITATLNDIPKRAEREKQRAAGKAKYEENMSKAEKNKAIKEQKKKADVVVKNIVKKANKGEIKGHNEMTILESILKLDERLGVSKAYLRQSFNDAVAELRNPTTTNVGKATVVDARNYVKKYANALLESNKNDLIKYRLVTQILNSIDKINSYASVMQQLEVIKNIMTKANYANRLRDAQRELAKAVKARMSTPGLADLVKFMRVSIKISNVQDLETLEKLTELAKKISETRTPGASLIKEFFDFYSSLKMPIPDTKETKEKDGKGKEGPSTKEIDESREASIKAIERVLQLGGYNPLETLRAMLGEDVASKTYKAIEAIKKYKTDSVKDFNYIVTFFNNVADVYESSIKGTGVTFNEYLMQQFATKEGFDTTNTILRLQARAAEEEMLESNVDKVVDGVAKLFDYKNKTLAGKVVFGEWLGKNTKRTFQQTIDRLVNYSSDASIAIEKAIRLPLLSAFTKAELRSQRILHNISEQIAKSKLEKSTYIHFQVLGMTLDYLNGDQKSHSYDAFVQNAIDIRRKIQNGTKDKNSRNQRDAKEGLAWFDKNIGKISDDLKSIDGPVANKVKAMDGKPVNQESDYVALIRTVLPSSLTLLFQNNFALNFSELGAEVRAVSMMYKGETPDERPFYWPRKAIGRIDAGRVNNESDVAVSIEDFDDYDQYAKKIETILNNGLDGAKFGQISSRTNPHSLARTQNENLVYSLNAFDVASSFFTRATADVYVTPELFKINKILGTESRKVFKGEGSTALRDAVILLSRSAYNVGYKKLSNPLLKSIDPLIGEASRQMLGSYFQLYKQAIPPVTSYLLSGEGDLVQRFIALKSVLGNKENLAILGDIATTRVTKAKEQLKKKYERIGEQTGLDFGVSRSNAVIDSFRELSAQQGGGNWVETLGDNVEKSKLGFIVRQSRVSSEYLPTADSYARLIIYAAEIERRSGMKFDEFMTRRKFTPADEKIVALADKQVNRVMGSSFSKERSAALTMNSNSEYENLWKKINYFMSNALAQNSTTFKDSLQAAILDPENRAEHAKRAGLITANAMVFSGVGIGISSLLSGLASGLGTLALGEEDEEEEKDSFARSLTGTAAGWTKDLFFGNSGNFINMLVTWAINLTDYSVKKATQMSDEEKLALVMKAARQYEANRMNDKQLVEELKNIQEQARISERTLLYQGAKSYGKTAELRPFVNLSGPYKGFINTPLDVIDLVYKEVDTKEGVKEKDMLKLASNFSKQVPFVQTDLSKVLQLTLKELQKERKPDGKEQNRR